MNPKYSRCSECGFYEPNMKADYTRHRAMTTPGLRAELLGTGIQFDSDKPGCTNPFGNLGECPAERGSGASRNLAEFMR